MRVGLNYTYSDGYLSDPYKLNDQRPQNHERIALSTGYRHFLIDANASIQFDYRYYADSWGVDSHTVELGWAQHFERTTMTPYFRYYSKREADFFEVVADLTKPHFADDYRLSSYGAMTLGARWAINLGDWTFELEGERYWSDANWGLYDGDSAPALVDFWRGTMAIIWRFD